MRAKLSSILILALGLLVAGVASCSGQSDLLEKIRSAQERGEWERSREMVDALVQAGDLSGEDLGRAYMYRGYAGLVLGEPDAALADYDRAEPLRPEDPALYYERGLVKHDLDDQQGAIADYDRALELDPEYLDVYLDRGLAWQAQEDYDRALADFERIIELDPNYMWAYMSRAWIYNERELYREALADYDAAERIDPTHPYIYTDRSHTWSALGRYDKAWEDLSKAMRIGPEDVYVRNETAWFLATCPDPNYRDGQGAVHLVEGPVIHEGVRDPWIVDTLAAAYAEVGRYDDAASVQEMAIQFMQEAGWTEEDISDARDRLELYRQRRPYRQTHQLVI